MPRSFLIKPRRHKLKEDRIQDVCVSQADVTYIPFCQFSPGRISEDSGIEDCPDPLMSPRSTNGSEGVSINSPVTPEGPLASVSRALEHVDCHGNRQMPQLLFMGADARKVPDGALPQQQAASVHSPPAVGPPHPRAQYTSLRHSRPIKDLPLIKRPFAYQEMMLQEDQGHHVTTSGVTQTTLSRVNRISPVKYSEPASPKNSDIAFNKSNYEQNDITVQNSTPIISHPSTEAHTSQPLNLVTKPDLSPRSDLTSTKMVTNILPQSQISQIDNISKPLSPYYDYYKRNTESPLYQRQSVIRDVKAPVNLPWVEREYTKVMEVRPMTSSTPRANSYDETENRRPQTPRAAPYHIPSKHYFTDITRIAAERSHNYVSIVKGQEVKSSAQRSPSTLNLHDNKRSTALQPRDISSNIQINTSPENTNKRPEVFVTSSHYTVLTPRRPSMNNFQVPQENQDVNSKSIPVRRPLQMHSPHSAHWDVENQPAAIFQDGRQDGFQDGHHDSVRRDISRFKCEDCGKSYATFSGLTKHKQFHCSAMFKKEFSCKYCNKTYVSLGALKMHIRTHTLPCKCPMCGKAFSRPWLLQGHVRTHTGEKPFSCQHCQRSFADRSNLRAHLQTHTDIKKYNCKRCPKTFSRMSLLLKHEDGGCANCV